MNADGAAANLVAVEHHVIGPGLGMGRIRSHQLKMPGHGRGKGMVAGHVAVLFLVVFKERELHNPEEVELVVVNKAHLFSDMDAQVAKGGVDHVRLACLEEENVPNLCIKPFPDGLPFLVREELGNRRLPLCLGLDFNPGQALGAVNTDKFGKGVDFLACQALAAIDLDGLYHGSRGKELEP